MDSEERQCENCGIEEYLERTQRIVKAKILFREIEDYVRVSYCLGCPHYLFEIDNWQSREE